MQFLLVLLRHRTYIVVGITEAGSVVTSKVREVEELAFRGFGLSLLANSALGEPVRDKNRRSRALVSNVGTTPNKS